MVFLSCRTSPSITRVVGAGLIRESIENEPHIVGAIITAVTRSSNVVVSR